MQDQISQIPAQIKGGMANETQSVTEEILTIDDSLQTRLKLCPRSDPRKAHGWTEGLTLFSYNKYEGDGLCELKDSHMILGRQSGRNTDLVLEQNNF